MKNVLIIDGHPYDKSFSNAIAETYHGAAQQASLKVERLALRNLQFDPILRNGYSIIQELEPDLVKAQELIKWAQHIVIITPIWWGGPTALLKGFLDRTLLPGYAFKYHKDSPWWDKLLAGRSAHLIVTSDGPSWWMQFLKGDSTVRILKSASLEFCGIKPVKVTRFGDIKNLNEAKRKNILDRIRKMPGTL